MTAPGPSGFDDPTDPGQKRLKGADSDFKAFVMGEIRPFNQAFTREVQAYMADHHAIDQELKAFMLHGFLAISEIHPSRCTLVHRQEGTSAYWQFVDTDVFELQRKRITELETKLSEARAELLHLRRR